MISIPCCLAPKWEDVTPRIIAEDALPPYDIHAGTEGAYHEDSVEITRGIQFVWRCESCLAVFATSRRVRMS